MIEIFIITKSDLQHAWEVYTNPDYIKNWNHASEDWECPEAYVDLKVGGKFKSVMRAKDKSVSFDFTGVYTKVENLKSIFYNMDDGRKAEVHFETIDNTTKVSVKAEPETTNPLELQQSGWQAILDNFQKECEKKLG